MYRKGLAFLCKFTLAHFLGVQETAFCPRKKKEYLPCSSHVGFFVKNTQKNKDTPPRVEWCAVFSRLKLCFFSYASAI